MVYDVIIIGGGIVGLATGYRLLEKRPDLKIAVLEKEKEVATHQTGHNSGVIHSGIYYKPGSLKAINCVKGYNQLIVFCKEHGITHHVCGKIIVATKEAELPILENIFLRGNQNGLTGLKKINPEEIKLREPHVKGIAGIWVPQAGIIDYKDVAKKLGELIKKSGAEIFLGKKVGKIQKGNSECVVLSGNDEFKGKIVINCAGLYSDEVARLTHPELDMRIIPFRGEYYKLKKEKEYLVNHLVYPVPDPNFPFLGVHFTRMIKGGIEAGPNAVLAFQREGYRKSDINISELVATLSWRGFQKIAMKYWETGMMEMYRSFSKTAFVKALQRLIPEIQKDDLEDGGSGVRAQACDKNGNLVDDFLILESNNIINVCNAPSPAATSNLAIGETIANKALKKLA